MEGLEERVTAVEQQCKSNGHRIDKVEQEQEVIHELAASIRVMASEQKHTSDTIKEVKEDVNRLDGKVDALELKPGKRWESIVDKIIWAVAGAIIAFVLARIGIG